MNKVIAIYPQGRSKTTMVEGQYYGTKIKVFPHKCYFDRYKIDDRYYWFYDEEKIYHIEDSETGKVGNRKRNIRLLGKGRGKEI